MSGKECLSKLATNAIQWIGRLKETLCNSQWQEMSSKGKFE